MQNESMLDRWSRSLVERQAVEDFLDWLSDTAHQSPRFSHGREAALDEFFEIDRRQLDKERLDLLDEARVQKEGK